jgi:tRNA threonylcarbamoyladenosine biosynthesis protein TsaE
LIKQTLDNVQATQQLAAQLAPLLQPGDVLLLTGELGAGKTTFTQGLAHALGIKRYVKSPTFTLIREYQEGRLPLYHMDVYRLENGGGDDLGLEEYFDGDGVSVVEWPQFVDDLWPANYLSFDFSRTGDQQRAVTITAQGQRGTALLQALTEAVNGN